MAIRLSKLSTYFRHIICARDQDDYLLNKVVVGMRADYELTGRKPVRDWTNAELITAVKFERNCAEERT